MSKSLFLILLCLICVNAQNETSQSDKNEAKGRVFSLFSIVTFKNSECTSTTDSTMKGTCYTTSECSSKGGTTSGNCASGFGVCCVFMVSACGSTVSQNCTYIQNPGYPSSYSSTSVTCSYTVQPVQSDICQLRLDYTNFVTSYTATSGACVDTFTATTPNGVTYPTICGTNTGYHMYLETGASTASSTLSFTIAAASATRTWKIKVSQIECYSTSRAPENCLQYFTGVSGNIQSFNYANTQMLQQLQYTNCIRQEEGYCAIDYTPAATTTDSFELGASQSAGVVASGCSPLEAMLIIETSTTDNVLYCGSYLVSITGHDNNGIIRDTTGPFAVGVTSKIASQGAGTGFNLVYTQVPCSN